MGVQPSKCSTNTALPLIPSPHHQAQEYSKNTVLVVEKPNDGSSSSSEEEEIGMPVEILTRVSLRYEPDGDFVSQINWIDEDGCKCCMLCARSLMITWSEDPRYWKWFPLQETSNIRIRVAALLNVCWLEIHGRVEMSSLTPETTYEAAFVVMISHTAYGWNNNNNNVPGVNLRLTVLEEEDDDVAGAGNRVQKREEIITSLMDKPRGQWIELKVGEFRTSVHGKEVEVSLFELQGGAWKNGLVVKGIRVRPKK